MIEIGLKNLEKYYGANHVLKGVTFEIMQGERIGLLGKNGAGKTTLFKILAGVEGIDGGSKMVRKGATVGLLDQIPDFPESYTVYDVLYSAFDDLMKIHNQMKELEKIMEKAVTDAVLRRYGNLQQLFEAKDGYSIEGNINRICIGLKIDNDMASREFNKLSGGEKTRIMLGRLMLEKPDILLLDEPTNHLDLSSIEWLENFFSEYKGTAIIISHDRYFLDKVVNRIVEIVDGKAELYEGNYSYYVKEKQQRYEIQLAKYNEEQKKIKQLEEAAKRMHEWAKIADNGAMHKRAFSIEKRIERMEKTDKPVSERSINGGFSQCDFSSKDVVLAKGLKKYYGDKKVIENLDLLIRKNENVAILGDNGSGKSTLIKIITGEVKPDGGTIKLGDSMRFAYLPQIVTFDNPKLSILETVIQELNMQEGPARSLMAKYKFKQEDVHKTVENLSGGEKSRLRLCIMMQKDVNLLILDEPTNHLDIVSREWLESALEDFSGTLVFVSHDRYFINKFASRICEMVDGNIEDYYGDYEYYKERKAIKQEQKESLPVKKEKVKREKGEKPNKKEDDSYKKLEELENLINSLEEKLKDINISMENSGDDYEALSSLYDEKTTIEEELDTLYEQWVSLNDI
ncbi:ribosomal protection-like ABC-F family protein [Lutispora thermophila]|uniref:ATPase components of ABC transporters with duplicated ATPase domains n=1 Tax=Lutispora thermophila DSM 19022 TaxID=1122184 RepID=A0A1M6BBG0_9FIRM|nr:ABC-F type ribosomal protection protein [Lutispora thermophila]SHI46080.1 ATPase components of ABC transporters with duplicated ATPase domains [Lutispora thermophila DSM 19022]